MTLGCWSARGEAQALSGVVPSAARNHHRQPRTRILSPLTTLLPHISDLFNCRRKGLLIPLGTRRIKRKAANAPDSLMIQHTLISRLDGLLLAASSDEHEGNAELNDVKGKLKIVLRRMNRNTEPQGSVESGKYTYQ